MRKKTAFLELHGRNEISGLISSETTTPVNIKFPANCCSSPYKAFQYRRTVYFPQLDCEQIPFLLNYGYEYLIMDLGSCNELKMSEFLRCDKKLILGSLSLWKIHSFEQFLSTFIKEELNGQGITYLTHSGSSKNISDFSKTHHIAVQHIPFIKNPFQIEKEHFSFMQNVVS